MSKVVTRIPPSPTGRFHIGTARTALFNYLYAKKHGGDFLLRIEDTDKARSKKEFEEEIMAGLAWLGLAHDGEVVRQSERVNRHTELLEKIVGEGKAYVSKEESKDKPGEMVEVVRLKNPGRSLTFNDEVRGDVTFDTTELKDFVIARNMSDPLYHFAVVVDDFDSGVTHVIRGEDHISNTPRQILIQEAIGAARPIYAHLPLILDEKRAKLSKRTGATALHDYREEGFLPEGITNYLALLGWNPGGDREDFSLTDLIEHFDLSGIHKGGAVFDREKLLSVNQRWMRKLSEADYIARGGFENAVLPAVTLLKERARTFGEAKALIAGELSALFNEPEPEKSILEAKGGETGKYLKNVIHLIEGSAGGISSEDIKAAIMPYADQEGRAAVLWPLRYALSGQERSPDPFTLISVLGKEKAISRIHKALDILVG